MNIKVFEQMTFKELNTLHGHLAEANLLMAKYRQEDETMIEFALHCVPFEKGLQLEMAVFSEICKRVKKGEQYEV